MNACFAVAGLKQHPDKTFIGRIDKGFDWLGTRFGARGLSGLAQKTIDNFAAKLRLLYEQARRDTPHSGACRGRWWSTSTGGWCGRSAHASASHRWPRKRTGGIYGEQTESGF